MSSAGSQVKNKVESFLCPDKQETLHEGWNIQRPKRCVSTNKDEDKSPKNHPKYCTSSLVSKIQITPLTSLQLPGYIPGTNQHLEIVVGSDSKKWVLLEKLTVPWEEAYEWKANQYEWISPK